MMTKSTAYLSVDGEEKSVESGVRSGPVVPILEEEMTAETKGNLQGIVRTRRDRERSLSVPSFEANNASLPSTGIRVSVSAHFIS